MDRSLFSHADLVEKGNAHLAQRKESFVGIMALARETTRPTGRTFAKSDRERWTSPFYLAISSRCTLYEVTLINYAGERLCAFLLVRGLAGPLRRTIAIRRDSYPVGFYSRYVSTFEGDGDNESASIALWFLMQSCVSTRDVHSRAFFHIILVHGLWKLY